MHIRLDARVIGWVALATSVACGHATPMSGPVQGPAVVVANQDRGVATIIELNTGRLVGHLDVDMDPHEAAASPDGRLVALVSPSTLFGDARWMAIVDVGTASLLRTIDLGEYRWPHGIAFLDNRTVAVSSRTRSAVVLVDTDSGRIQAAIDAGAPPYLLQLAPATQRAYTSGGTASAITEMDLRERRLLRRFPIPDGPAGFAVSPDGSSVWAATWTETRGGAIRVLDLATGAIVAVLDDFRQPRRLAFTSDGMSALITDGDHVRVVDPATRRERGRIHVGSNAGASGVTCVAGTSVCYATLSQAGALVELDVTTLTIRRRWDIGSGADGLAYVAR